MTPRDDAYSLSHADFCARVLAERAASHAEADAKRAAYLRDLFASRPIVEPAVPWALTDADQALLSKLRLSGD